MRSHSSKDLSPDLQLHRAMGPQLGEMRLQQVVPIKIPLLSVTHVIHK